MPKVRLKTKFKDVKDGPIRVLLIFLGIFVGVFSIPCFFYVATFYSGIILIFTGIFMICFAGLSTRKAICPICNHENSITVNRGSFQCRRCGSEIEIDWEK